MKAQITFRHWNDAEANQKVGDACMLDNTEESLTQQQFADDADINVLAYRYGLDNQPMPTAPIDPSFYGDFTNVPDLRTAMDLVRDAENRFMDLPAKLRARFDNRPAKMWHFVNDPENADEAVRLGLLQRVPEGNAPAVQAEEPPKGEQGT
ncbi:MAG: internal scaffolding protein [Microvirus sp.]|nr:MAG: internal scaffolding protein [Microvirus sp.]